MPELRFGVVNGNRYSSPWIVRASAGRREIFVMQRATGGFFHVSLHEDPDHWHLKVKTAPRVVEIRRWPRPAPLVPGVTRAVELLVTPATVRRPAPPRAHRVYWAPAPGPRKWVSFDVFIEEPHVTLASWPGRDSMGTRLVGRLPLPDGSRLCVVVWSLDGMDNKMNLPTRSAEERKRIRKQAARGRLNALVHGTTIDGALQITEFVVQPPRNPLQRLRMLIGV